MGGAWRTSSRCDANSCVEVATMPMVAVRDTSLEGAGPVLMFTADAWGKFMAAIRDRG